VQVCGIGALGSTVHIECDFLLLDEDGKKIGNTRVKRFYDMVDIEAPTEIVEKVDQMNDTRVEA
jgi:hypothetical protein